MSEEVQLGEMTLAPGVLETIVTVAAREVEGVVSVVGSQQGLAQMAQKAVNRQAARSVSASVSEGAIEVALHIEVEYGRSLRLVGTEVQEAVAEAIRSQLGASVASVDVYIDAVRFEG